ncbi:hypothetical protein C8Q70DRAFT_1050118 [Cubamyces menziesii]|nr:hypothetical protein C8Q70DRAFT_1050118 [Cubamyces menziesii]
MTTYTRAMMPQYSPADPRPVRARKGTRSTGYYTIEKARVLQTMSLRCAASSLEPFLGTYRIVWDSESNYDPRDVLFAGPDRDPSDGLLTLSRPQHAHAWPKEPAPASSVVLRLCDSFIGTNRTASTLKPSPRPVPTSESSSSLGGGAPSQSTSSLLSSSPAPSPLSPSFTSSFVPPLQSRSSASSSSLSTAASSSSRTGHAARTRSFWRFDWDPSFPRLGFRFEGMDLTAARGHTLSFSHIRDDHGHPFAVVELRPTGWDDSEGDGVEEVMDEEEEGEWASHRAVRRKRMFARKRQSYITVVAKRVQDQYSREGLSEGERERLGMVELDGMGPPFD